MTAGHQQLQALEVNKATKTNRMDSTISDRILCTWLLDQQRPSKNTHIIIKMRQGQSRLKTNINKTRLLRTGITLMIWANPRIYSTLRYARTSNQGKQSFSRGSPSKNRLMTTLTLTPIEAQQWSNLILISTKLVERTTVSHRSVIQKATSAAILLFKSRETNINFT